MHKKDFVKEIIEKYIKAGRDFYELTPGFLSQTEELNGFAERTLKRGRTEFKQENPALIEKHSKNKASARKKLYKYLEKNPTALPKEIEKAFPELDQQTITSCRALWKEEEQGSSTNFSGIRTSTRKPYNTVKKQVNAYLKNDPNCSLRRLKSKFPNAKQASLERYHKQWVNDTAAKYSPILSSEIANQGDNLDDIIQMLRHMILTQNKTIEALKSQNELLKNRQGLAFPEMDDLNRDDIRQVEQVIRTYIKGVKSA